MTPNFPNRILNVSLPAPGLFNVNTSALPTVSLGLQPNLFGGGEAMTVTLIFTNGFVATTPTLWTSGTPWTLTGPLLGDPTIAWPDAGIAS